MWPGSTGKTYRLIGKDYQPDGTLRANLAVLMACLAQSGIFVELQDVTRFIQCYKLMRQALWLVSAPQLVQHTGIQ